MTGGPAATRSRRLRLGADPALPAAIACEDFEGGAEGAEVGASWVKSWGGPKPRVTTKMAFSGKQAADVGQNVYHRDAASPSLYIDELAIGKTRLGCPPARKE